MSILIFCIQVLWPINLYGAIPLTPSWEGVFSLKIYDTSQIRNLVLAGHTGAGKTSLSEAMLWTLKQSTRLGKTEEGNTHSDYDPEEVRRHHSIQTSLIPIEYDGHKINLLDLPGFRDFVGEIKGSCYCADSLLLVYDATGGVETGAEFIWGFADEFKMPQAIFINKLDKEHASFEQSLEKIKTGLGARVVPLTLPIGEELDFSGVIDLIKMKKVVENGQKVSYETIPDELAEAAEVARAVLVEAAAEGDDDLMMKFLEDEALTPEEVLTGLRGAVAERRIVPVLCGSATSLIGIRPLLNFITESFPDPTAGEGYSCGAEDNGDAKRMSVTPDGPLTLFVFKTVSDPYAGRLSFFKVLGGTAKGESTLTNVRTAKSERLAHLLTCMGKQSENIDSLAAGDIGAVAKLDATRTDDTLIDPSTAAITIEPAGLPKPTTFMAINAKSRADEDKVGMGFHRLIEQDPTLHLERDPSIRQTILSGMGEIHLAVAAARLKDIAKVEIEMEIPRVPYRETITKKATGQGKHKKQSGGHGQYGDCHIRFEPLPEGSGFEFVWEVVGGVIPTNFRSAVEKGLTESLDRGVLSGSPTVDLRAACYDGTHHAIDSSDMAFKVASSIAFKNVIPKCGPIILEPIHKIEITIPEEYMGDVMGDLNGRRGRILGMNSAAGKQVIEALVPLAELYTYGRQLNSLSQGRGVFQMEYDHYERTPNEIQEKIIAEAKRIKEEEAS
jgi:elongation factor G